MKKLSFYCLIILLFALLGIGLYYLHHQYTNALFIQTPEHKIRLSYEVADTPEKQTIGLMYRQKIPDDYGMVFLFPETKIIYMWMKNTYIPLDMIFFDGTGKITHIHKNATPHDLSIISSENPAKGVIEVNAGFVNTHKIAVGHQVILSAINN